MERDRMTDVEIRCEIVPEGHRSAQLDILFQGFSHLGQDLGHYRCNRSNSPSKSVCCAFRR